MIASSTGFMTRHDSARRVCGACVCWRDNKPARMRARVLGRSGRSGREMDRAGAACAGRVMAVINRNTMSAARAGTTTIRFIHSPISRWAGSGCSTCVTSDAMSTAAMGHTETATATRRCHVAMSAFKMHPRPSDKTPLHVHLQSRRAYFLHRFPYVPIPVSVDRQVCRA